MWIMWTEAEFISVTLVCHLCWGEILRGEKLAVSSACFLTLGGASGMEDYREATGPKKQLICALQTRKKPANKRDIIWASKSCSEDLT